MKPIEAFRMRMRRGKETYSSPCIECEKAYKHNLYKNDEEYRARARARSKRQYREQKDDPAFVAANRKKVHDWYMKRKNVVVDRREV